MTVFEFPGESPQISQRLVPGNFRWKMILERHIFLNTLTISHFLFCNCIIFKRLFSMSTLRGKHVHLVWDLINLKATLGLTSYIQVIYSTAPM